MRKRACRLTGIMLLIVFSILASLQIAIADADSAVNSTLVLSVEKVKDKISEGDWAIFNLKITNKGRGLERVTISVREEGAEWSVIAQNTSDYVTGIEILPFKSVTTRLLLKEKGLLPSATKPHIITLDMTSENSGMRSTFPLKVFIMPEPTFDYASDVEVIPAIPRFMDPRVTYSFMLGLKNKNEKDIKDLDITLESVMVNRQATVSLEPSGEKNVEFSVDLEDGQKPLLDTLTITITEGNQTVYRGTESFEAVAYRLPFSKNIETDEGFLVTTDTLTLTNNENVQESQTHTESFSPVRSWFMTSTPEAGMSSEKIDGKRLAVFSWHLTLKPGQSSQIILKTDYRLPFLAIILIVAAVLLFIFLRDPITLTKQAEIISTADGGINELKVVISLKNRTHKIFKDVRLVDMIPGLTKIDQRIKIGTIEPERVMHTHKGTILDWKIDVEGKEERLITYKVKTHLTIVGGLKLPAATVLIEQGRRKHKIRSNEAFVST